MIYSAFVTGSHTADSGGCSRILHKCDYETIDTDLLHYCSKASQKERHGGLDGKNTHPCVKPISLNTHICNLFKLPKECNQNILLPFSGSGSKVIGAIKAGFNPDNIIAFEVDTEFMQFAQARIAYHTGVNIEIEGVEAVKPPQPVQQGLF